jgi:transposase/IS5 family transposase
MARFIAVDRDTVYLFPPSVQDWLGKDHLARFVVETVEQLDLGALERAYAGRGSAAFHPSMLLGLLIYGYATGVFSSRAIERATYDSVAFRYVAANTHPDHDTINEFRKRFFKQIGPLFVQVLLIARELGVLKLGHVALDGTKVHANASKHSALSWGHANKIEAQLNAEVAELLRLGAQADQAEVPDGMSLPKELELREQRLQAIAEAKHRIAERAAQRQAIEQADYEAKCRAREAKRRAGKPPRGPDPQPPAQGPKDTDQVNLSDPDSRIMKATGKGFEQAYNAQAAVDTATMLVVGQHLTQAPNDKQQIEPMIERLDALPEALGEIEGLSADTGYASARNVACCEAAQITPYIATGKERHHPPLLERFSEPTPLVPAADALARMQHRLATPAGKAVYAQRKSTVEPVFGIIKHVMGFRQFMLRGLQKVQGEWTLVCMAWNMKRLCVLAG